MQAALHKKAAQWRVNVCIKTENSVQGQWNGPLMAWRTGPLEWTQMNECIPVWFSLSGLLWLSQLVFAPRHPASPSAPLRWCLAPSVPGGGGAALCLLLVLFHHTLPICSPHGLCLLSLLRERNTSTAMTSSGHYDMKSTFGSDSLHLFHLFPCTFWTNILNPVFITSWGKWGGAASTKCFSSIKVRCSLGQPATTVGQW